MSSGPKMLLAQATEVAHGLVALLEPICERVEIAGSIRRGEAVVGDIEIVAAPAFEDDVALDVWGGARPVRLDLLAINLEAFRSSGTLVPRLVEVHRADGRIEHQQRVGDRYRALTFRGCPVDLFIVRPPAQWGVVFTIRTGPADFSHRLVTEVRKRYYRVESGQLLHLGKPVPCPEERDFFEAVGLPWIQPADRRPELVRL